MKNIIITDENKLAQVKNAMARDGADKLHILADFDRTLTYAFVNGEKIPSLISVLRDGNYLTPDYAPAAHVLYDKYHPIEINPTISVDEKKKAMRVWWQEHFALLIRSGLNKKDIEKVIHSEKIQLREGMQIFLDTLYQNGIPLVILSSNGLGEESIAMYLEKRGKLHSNIHIVCNNFKWNAQGDAIAVKEPVIHSLNKDEVTLHTFPFFEEIESRKNVILLGDSLDDVGMVIGFKYDNLIKIGFLNENIEENLEQYQNTFDVIITNDGSVDYVNELLSEIV